jgi:hypothetical protein
MSRLEQLLDELDEESRLNCKEVTKLLINEIVKNFDEYLKQKETNYDITIDELIIYSLKNELNLQQLLTACFAIYMKLNRLRVQEPFFKFSKKGISSERIKCHIKKLIQDEVIHGNGKFSLTYRGLFMRKILISKFKSYDIECILNKIEKLTTNKDLKNFCNNILKSK